MRIILLSFAFAVLLQIPPVRENQLKTPDYKSHQTKNFPSQYAGPCTVMPSDPATDNKKGGANLQSKWWPPPPIWDIYWPTFGLVLLGCVASWIALRTLGDLRQQTKNTKGAAEATLLNAKAIINAERAWIDGDLTRGLPVSDPGWEEISVSEYTLRIINYGRTPAYIQAWKIGTGCLERELDKFSRGNLERSARKEIHMFFPPEQHPKELARFNMAEYFNDWIGVMSGTKTGVFEMTIEYFDIISGEGKSRQLRETYFAYSYNTTEGRFRRLDWLNEYK
ncbi:MAG TPA: hypothetical protein VKR82_08610 [Candidatus Acidoferrales bacterium]|nr:hypothetical protein [Candidatus Acidoferrales bacterium]